MGSTTCPVATSPLASAAASLWRGSNSAGPACGCWTDRRSGSTSPRWHGWRRGWRGPGRGVGAACRAPGGRPPSPGGAAGGAGGAAPGGGWDRHAGDPCAARPRRRAWAGVGGFRRGRGATVRAFLVLLSRDLRLALRSGGDVAAVLAFFVITVVLFP